MCRWLACTGSPVLLDAVLYEPVHSLIDQNLRPRVGVETTNGDRFGVCGWYAADNDTPAVFRDTGPAWRNRNLREIADHVRSRLFFALIRALPGPVQQTNGRPFRHGRWMWMAKRRDHRFPPESARSRF